MLSRERMQHQPYDSIARVFTNWQIQRNEEALETIIYSVLNGTENAIKKPTTGIQKLMRSNHPEAPHLCIGALAQFAFDDLNASGNQGHLDLAFVEEPETPMLQVRKSIVPDSRDHDSVIIWIAVNINDAKTHLWLHTHLADEILLPAIRTFADASVTLAYELHADPRKVLYRSQFPPLE